MDLSRIAADVARWESTRPEPQPPRDLLAYMRASVQEAVDLGLLPVRYTERYATGSRWVVSAADYKKLLAQGELQDLGLDPAFQLLIFGIQVVVSAGHSRPPQLVRRTEFRWMRTFMGLY